MQFQLSFIGIAAILATPATAQQTSPGSIPIYDITPPALPTPTPTPTASPSPRPAAPPRAAATPRAAPATPRAVPTPAARPTPVATPTPRATSSPVVTPTAAPIATPTLAATPVPLPTPEVSPAAEPSPAIVASDETPAGGGDALPWWAWFLGGIVVASLAIVAIGRLRRGRVQEVYDEAPVAPVPLAPVPVVPPVAPPAPPAPRPVRPVTPPAAPVAPVVPPAPAGPFLEFQLAPLRVGVEGDNVLLDFDLTVGNPASTPVAEVSIATLLLTANAGQDEQVAAFFANDAKRGLESFALGAGERRHLEATMTLPRVAVNIVTANDRTFFVPLIAIDARYRWEDGRESRTTASFMVGPSAANGKLAPIFTDRGDRMVDRLEVRLHGPVRRT